jgi:hypothetical protein
MEQWNTLTNFTIYLIRKWHGKMEHIGTEYGTVIGLNTRAKQLRICRTYYRSAEDETVIGPNTRTA